MGRNSNCLWFSFYQWHWLGYGYWSCTLNIIDCDHYNHKNWLHKWFRNGNWHFGLKYFDTFWADIIRWHALANIFQFNNFLYRYCFKRYEHRHSYPDKIASKCNDYC